MTKLIINADDFGYSKAVNYGIIEAYQSGVVTSTTLMTNMPGAAHAAALAIDNPGLGVGIHLVLTCGNPIRNDVSSLMTDNGAFHRLDELAKYAQPIDIEKEFMAQMEMFFSLGLTPTHIDSHHHVHGQEQVYMIVERLAQKYKLPVRKVTHDVQHSSNFKLAMVDCFLPQFYGNELTVTSFLDLLPLLVPYKTAEIMCHPAYLDKAVLTGSSYSTARVQELAILTDSNVKTAIENYNLELCTYKEISY